MLDCKHCGSYEIADSALNGLVRLYFDARVAALEKAVGLGCPQRGRSSDGSPIGLSPRRAGFRECKRTGVSPLSWVLWWGMQGRGRKQSPLSSRTLGLARSTRGHLRGDGCGAGRVRREVQHAAAIPSRPTRSGRQRRARDGHGQVQGATGPEGNRSQARRRRGAAVPCYTLWKTVVLACLPRSPHSITSGLLCREEE